MSREIITYLRASGGTTQIVDITNKIIAREPDLPSAKYSENPIMKLRPLKYDGTPFSIAELLYDSYEYGADTDRDLATDPPIYVTSGGTSFSLSTVTVNGKQYAEIAFQLDLYKSEVLALFASAKEDKILYSEFNAFTAGIDQPQLTWQFKFTLQPKILAVGTVTPPNNEESLYRTTAQQAAIDATKLNKDFDTYSEKAAMVDGDQLAVNDSEDSGNTKYSTLTNIWTWITGKADSVYLKIADIIDNLTSTETAKALSANQGRMLKQLIDNISSGFSRRKTVADILETPPITPSPADRYLVGSLSNNVISAGFPTGEWSGHGLDIAEWNGTSWDFTSPLEGYIMLVDSQDKDALYVDDGSPQWQLRNIAVANHNDAANIQGGTTDEYYHITAAQNSNLANIGKVLVDAVDSVADYLVNKFSTTEFQKNTGSGLMELLAVPISKLSGAFWLTETPESVSDNATTNIVIGDKTLVSLLTVDLIIKTTVSTVDYYRHGVIHIICDGLGASTPEILSHVYPASSNPLDGAAVTFTADIESGTDNIRLNITTSGVGASSTVKWKILSKTGVFS